MFAYHVTQLARCLSRAWPSSWPRARCSSAAPGAVESRCRGRFGNPLAAMDHGAEVPGRRSRASVETVVDGRHLRRAWGFALCTVFFAPGALADSWSLTTPSTLSRARRAWTPTGSRAKSRRGSTRTGWTTTSGSASKGAPRIPAWHGSRWVAGPRPRAPAVRSRACPVRAPRGDARPRDRARDQGVARRRAHRAGAAHQGAGGPEGRAAGDVGGRGRRAGCGRGRSGARAASTCASRSPCRRTSS